MRAFKSVPLPITTSDPAETRVPVLVDSGIRRGVIWVTTTNNPGKSPEGQKEARQIVYEKLSKVKSTHETGSAQYEWVLSQIW